MTYQSFPGKQGGSSKSADKLVALSFPENMAGKSFLDIGCNEGFFCLEAKRRGAKSVMGIDKSTEYIESANSRASEAHLDIKYICDHWNNLPKLKFDIILFSSALHYADEPIDLFDVIHERLVNDGLFILECGYMPELTDSSITRVIRKGGPRFYPRIDVLVNNWLKKFAVRRMGPSIKQSGDPISRAVFHCRKWKTTVVFIVGDGETGKTTIAQKMTSDIVIRTDVLFNSRIAEQAKIPEVEKAFRERKERARGNRPGNSGIATAWKSITRDSGELKYFSGIVLEAIELNRGVSVIAVEGYALKSLLPILRPALEKRGFRSWIMTK